MPDLQRGQPILVNRRARSAMDKGVIVIFVLLGSAAIIALRQWEAPLAVRIGAPCALMLIYAGFTALRTRFRLRYDQAGDNCYYLGFIYTLLSLAVTLYLIQSNVTGGKQVTDIIRDFGVALSTTLIGIVLRVWLNQLREDPADIEEAIQKELFEQSQKLSGHIRAAVVAFDDMRNETADKLKNYVHAMQQVVNEHQERVVDLREATTNLAKNVERLAQDLNAAEIPTGRLRDAAAGTVAALQGARIAMADVETGGRALVSQFAEVGKSMESTSTQSTALTRATREAVSSAESASRALASLGDASETAASRVRTAAEGIERTGDAMNAAARSSSAAANEHVEAVAKAAESMRSSAARMDVATATAAARVERAVRESETALAGGFGAPKRSGD